MRVLFAGGTGFVGKTFLDGLVPLTADEPLVLTLLSRDPAAFLAANRTLVERPGVEVSVLRQTLPELTLTGRFDAVVHGAEIPAAEVAADYMEQSAQVLRALLGFAERAGARRFVYLSSGAVYTLDTRLKAPFAMQPDFPDAGAQAGAYAYSKYLSELEVRKFSQATGISHVILRIFNVASQYVPLTGRYALGNFALDLVDPVRRAIRINGSGRDRRSFIGGAQLAGLIEFCLSQAPDGAIYNVCSEQTVSILELAELVRDIAGGNKPIEVAAPDAPSQDYTGRSNLPHDFISTHDSLRRALEQLIGKVRKQYNV